MQQISSAATEAEAYISEYNIHMGALVNDKMERLFPGDKVLISHWGIRDELKSQYNSENGLEKQRMIYALMNRIVNQEIPRPFINSDRYAWNPLNNALYDGTIKFRLTRTRYAVYADSQLL
jgi:hypothetical protein